LGIKIIAGSDFTESTSTGESFENTDGFKYSLILNETAVKEIDGHRKKVLVARWM